jgi:hypothetical protein
VIRFPAKGWNYADAAKDERLRRWAETAYRATVRAHACDVLRSYLPAATLTNVGMFGVGPGVRVSRQQVLLTRAERSERSSARRFTASSIN